MNIKEISEQIKKKLDTVRTVDPHCHLRPPKPAVDDLAQLLLYHHVWIEMISSGMPQDAVSKGGMCHELEDPGIPAIDRIRTAIPWLANIRNTTLGTFLRWILTDLYGTDPHITEDNVEKIFALIEEKGKDPAWQEYVLKEKCGIDYSLTVFSKGGEPYADNMKIGVEWAPVNLLSGKTSSKEVLEMWERQGNTEINSADDYRNFVMGEFKEYPWDDLQYLGLWVAPYITPEMANEKDVTRILKKVKEGSPVSNEEIGSIAYFGVQTMLEELRKTTQRVIQLFVGAEVLLPHRAVTQWGSSFCGAIGRLAYEFPEFHFNASTATDIYTQDLGILSKHVPNISMAGYWWHMLYPFYIRKSIETRIDMIPMNKIVGFFSDAYHAEWCYPKLRIIKEIFHDILTERVDRGWLELDTALDMIEKIFYQNAMDIYKI